MSKELAIKKDDIVDVVSERVNELQNNGDIDLPPNYSVGNALKSAWLELQETSTKSGKPALESCSNNSIANALLDMVVQGLNPSKQQGYFIAYGGSLEFQRSYFGTIAVTKRVTGAQDVTAEVVYRGDEFDYEIKNGRKKIIEHKQKLENKINGEVLAAYMTIHFDDGRPDHQDLMTIDQIKQSWKQGHTYKEGGNSSHNDFTEEMCKKTVINRGCKAYINSSSDSSLMVGSVNSPDIAKAEHETQQEIEDNANSEVIDIGPDQAEADQEEEPESEPTQEAPQEEEPEPEKVEQEPESTGTEGPAF